MQKSSHLLSLHLDTDLGREDEKHDLKGPDGMAMLVLGLRKVVQQVEEVIAALSELVVCVLLQVGELLRVGVHPVPDGLL